MATITMKSGKASLTRKAVEAALKAPYKVTSFAEAGKAQKYLLNVTGMT